MVDTQIRVKVEEFRAIAHADINIEGITIVAGENGCGKSTLSKLLYYVFKSACDYESLVEAELREKLKDVERLLDIAIFEIDNSLATDATKSAFERELSVISKSQNFLSAETLERWSALIANVGEVYYVLSNTQKNSTSSNKSKRLIKIFSLLLRLTNEPTELSPVLFQEINKLVHSYYNEAFSKLNARPIDLFEGELNQVFARKSIPKYIEVSEYDAPILATGGLALAKPYSIHNTIYTDTPMCIGVRQSGNKYWDDINDLLNVGNHNASNHTSGIISNIISGEVLKEDSPFAASGFVFKRKDGVEFLLQDAATGIKSFGLLQLLLNNGSLNSKSLLIIDEPEVHLHPQWIVEYARLVVLLNKELGIKFFIASHDPDFVSAIRYISEKEGVLNNVNFYLAEKQSDAFSYNYNHLGVDIEPIFKSFNKAIDRIDEYGI